MPDSEVPNSLGPCVGMLHVKEDDFRTVLLSSWAHTSGRADWPMLFLHAGMTLTFAGALAYQLYKGALRSDDPVLVIGAAMLTGFYFAIVLQLAKTMKIRHRLAGNVWEHYRFVPSPLSLHLVAEGMRFIGPGYDQTFPWLHLKRMWLTPGEKIWAAQATSDAFIWMPASAFATHHAFDEFADHVHDLWKANRPTGKGFEVLAKPAITESA